MSIPNSVSEIGRSTFGFCNALESVVLPSELSIIPENTFFECSLLRNITIPKSVLSFGADAFYKAYAIKDIYYEGSQTEWNKINKEGSSFSLSNPTIHYNYPINHSGEIESEYEQLVYESNIEYGSNRVKIDDEIELKFDKKVSEIDKSKISVIKTNSNDLESGVNYIITDEENASKLTIEKKGTWIPYQSYKIVIPVGAINVKGSSKANAEIEFSFTTNLLTGKASTYALPNEYVSKEYPTVAIISDKSVQPFPTSR